MTVQAPVRTLLFSTLYPSSVRPGLGIFVETRLRELLVSGQVQTKVVAPVPWFYSKNPRFGDYARMAQTPKRETYHGIDVLHPRYLLPPKVGMSIAPFVLAAGAVGAVARLLDEGYDFDLIDAHYYYPDGVAAALLAKYFKKPFTVTARGSDINLLANYAVPRKLIRWAGDKALASIGVSSAMTGAMAGLGLPVSRLITMPNGVDLVRFRPMAKPQARALLGWSSAPTLLSVGNLVVNKGHHLAIEALNQLTCFNLVIVGVGPERQALQTLATRMGLNARVTLVGEVAQKDLAPYYSAADILVLASSREGWPNVLLESLACGTPVVATDVGGVPEIIQKDGVGRLMKKPSSADLVNAVKLLWSRYPDPSVVRAYAEKFSWQSTTVAQQNLFENIKKEQRKECHA